MNYFLYLLVIFSFTSIYSQKRELGLNLHGSKNTLFAELSYKKIVKKNILIETGIGFGNFGRFEKSNDNNKFSSVTPFSPYYLWTNQSGEPFLYLEQKYKLNNIGGKVFLGIGYRWKLNSRINLDGIFQLAYYIVRDNHYHYYEDQWTDLPPYEVSYKTIHHTISNGLKVNVNYDIGRKVSVLVGGQVLFLVPIKNELYQPNEIELPMMGVEFNIVCGIIYKL